MNAQTHISKVWSIAQALLRSARLMMNPAVALSRVLLIAQRMAPVAIPFPVHDRARTPAL